MDNLTICVVGLGYVGLPLALELSKHFEVIGFDVNEKRVNNLRNGIDTNEEYSSDVLLNSDMLLTSDVNMLKHNNFFIVTVPTPITNGNNPDFEPLRSASELIGKYADFSKKPIVVYESTVYPGVTEEICVPIIEKTPNVLKEKNNQFKSDNKCGHDFFVGYSPERINPGDTVHTVTTITKIVSGMNEEILNVVDSVYSKITKTHRASSIKVAEAAKVIENSQRDLNIAFVNELALIFNKLNIDTNDVLDAAATKWNFLNFRPGSGSGGHCIGIDPYWILYAANLKGFNSQIISAGRRINESMPSHIVNLTIQGLNKYYKSVNGSKILVLGATFKENCKDTRNSKVENIILELEELGAKVFVHDPYYENYKIDFHKTEKIGLAFPNWIENIDIVIFAVPHKIYDMQSLGKQWWLNNIPVVDVKGVLSKDFNNVIRL